MAVVASSFGAAQAQSRHAGILQVAAPGKFRAGHYTLADGTRHAGRIRIWRDLRQNLLQVDLGNKQDPQNIAPAALRSVAMEADSFVVVRHFQPLAATERPLLAPVDFARVMLSGKLQVLRHDRLVASSSGGPYGGQTVIASTWLLRTAPDTTLYLVPFEAPAFATYTARLFADAPPLCQRITAGIVGPADFERILYAYLFKRDVEQVSYEDATTIFR